MPRQLQNTAYIPSYHDIGKLWRGSVGMTESEGSELVRWQRKAAVVTYTAKGFEASIWPLIKEVSNKGRFDMALDKGLATMADLAKYICLPTNNSCMIHK